jgi:predicted MFS family arabinose efflux permease
MRPTPRWPAILALYGGALVIGATFSLFAASSSYLRDLRGFTDSAYGSIFLPQPVTAIAGAIIGGFASRSRDLGWLYRVALVCFLCAQGLLALTGWSGYFLGTTAALLTTMAATGAWGLGFGLGGGPINGLLARQFPRTTGTAITAWYMCGGVGLTVSPFLVAACERMGHWICSPLLLATLTAAIVAGSFVLPGSTSGKTTTQARVDPPDPAYRDGSFWCLAVAAVCYGLAEATFSNWAVLYSRDELHLSPAEAAATLSAFWGCLTLGRLASSVVALRVGPAVFLRALPILTICAFAMIHSVHGPLAAIAAFGFAGVACSGFFPMLIAYAAERHQAEVAWMAAMLTACTMTGDGVGSYVIGVLRALVGTRDLYLYAVAYPLVAFACVVAAGSMRLRMDRISGFFRPGRALYAQTGVHRSRARQAPAA